MTGAAATPVFLVLFNGVLLLLVALPLAVAIQALWGGSWSGAVAQGMVVAALLLASVAAGLVWLRWHRRHRRPIDLTSWWLSRPRAAAVVGGKALGLHRLSRSGLPVADGWVLTPEALADPARAARRISVCCRRRGIRRLIVRSSFPEEDAGRLYPGVFQSVPDVNAWDPGAVRTALESVLASGSAEVVERYRRRAGLAGDPARQGCVVVQRFLEVSVTGVMCSFHPGRRRLDEVTVEAGPPGGSPSVDVHSLLLGRWTVRNTELGDDVRRELLDALRVAEALLRGPVVVEFGVLDGGLVLFQLRRAPRIPLEEIWTQSGPVGLNPEALPELQREVLYGEDLGLLERRLERSLLENAAPDAPAPAVRAKLVQARPVVEYGGVAATSRFFPRAHGPLGLLARAVVGARAAAVRARRALASVDRASGPDSIRRLAEAQSPCQESAERLRALRETLTSAVRHRPDFAPLLPWHRWLAHGLQGAARTGEELRERLHAALLEGLRSLAPVDPAPADWEQLSLAEWRRVRAGEAPAVSPELLRRRRESFERDRDSTLPPALVVRDGELVPAPPVAAPVRAPGEGVFAADRLRLHVLFDGVAAGPLVSAAGAGSGEGSLVIVPDASLRWLERIVGARGVVFVGGGQLLSHLALAALELRIPTLAGLTVEEAESLAGRAGRIEGDLLFVEDARSPAPSVPPAP